MKTTFARGDAISGTAAGRTFRQGAANQSTGWGLCILAEKS